MNTDYFINGRLVKFEVIQGQIFATSLDISKVFEKRHDNILAQIRSLPKDDFTLLNFKETAKNTRIQASGGYRKDKYYNITRDGFSLLVMGFTGKKAYEWKIAFINAFNKMEKSIKMQLTIPDENPYESNQWNIDKEKVFDVCKMMAYLSDEYERLGKVFLSKAQAWEQNKAFVESRLESILKNHTYAKTSLKNARQHFKEKNLLGL